MKWSQSDNQIICIIGGVVLGLYGGYKVLQILAGLTIGGSFGVGLGGMSGSQSPGIDRKVETDAPAQVIYRLDNHRFLTLENYIACDKGGRVYYNDTQRGIKTFIGSDEDNYNDRLGNDVSSYQGTIINGADNGYLAFPGAVTDQYCGSGNSQTGCPVFFYFSADYGKTFVYQVIARGYNTPERFSKLKVMVANDGVYFQDSDQRASSEFKEMNRFYLCNGELIDFISERERQLLISFKDVLIKKEKPYAEKYNYTDQYIYDYVHSATPPMTDDEKNSMLNEYFNIKNTVEKKVYGYKLKPPVLPEKSINVKYQCNKSIKARTIIYTWGNNGRKVVKNDQ